MCVCVEGVCACVRACVCTVCARACVPAVPAYMYACTCQCVCVSVFAQVCGVSATHSESHITRLIPSKEKQHQNGTRQFQRKAIKEDKGSGEHHTTTVNAAKRQLYTTPHEQQWPIRTSGIALPGNKHWRGVVASKTTPRQEWLCGGGLRQFLHSAEHGTASFED